METTDNRGGWQAEIVGPVQDSGDEAQPVTDEATAKRIAASVGVEIEEEIDAENGLWMVRLTDEQIEQMREDSGWLDATSAWGSVLVDAGDVFEGGGGRG